MGQSDIIGHGPPPADGSDYAFGARAVTGDGTSGVRIMLKGFDLMRDERGELIAYITGRVPETIQAVQALRQALNDARRGKFR